MCTLSETYYSEKINNSIYRIGNRSWDTPSSSNSCWLIIGSKKALLIDAGNPGKGLRRFVESMIQGKELITALSHGHFDHVGAIDEFKEIYMNPADIHLLEGGNGSIQTPFHGRIIPLFENDFFDLGDRIIYVYSVVGHTKGSLVFFDEKSRILFSGDSVARRGFFTDTKETPISRYFDDLLRIEKAHFTKIASAHDTYLLNKSLIRHFISTMISRIDSPDGEFELPGVGEFYTIHHGEGVSDPDYLSISFPKEDQESMIRNIRAWAERTIL